MKWIDERTIEDHFFQLPLGVRTTETMQYAKNYKPEPIDVFVATQMKCGTTWMQ
jgi:hypothetical protein